MRLSFRKAEGIAVEMVDCIIRILDYLSKIGVDIEKNTVILIEIR